MKFIFTVLFIVSLAFVARPSDDGMPERMFSILKNDSNGNIFVIVVDSKIENAQGLFSNLESIVRKNGYASQALNSEIANILSKKVQEKKIFYIRASIIDNNLYIVWDIISTGATFNVPKAFNAIKADLGIIKR